MIRGLATRFRIAAIALAAVFANPVLGDERIAVSSKIFPESFVLGEMLALLLEHEGFEVERRLGLGPTMINYNALVAGEVDVYAEYTGTISRVILEEDRELTLSEINRELSGVELELLEPFGFNNTYALAVPEEIAAERNLTKVSQLINHRDLRYAFSHEFVPRPDGWKGLQSVYGFDWVPGSMTHELAYEAIAQRKIDVTDAYTTDGKLSQFNLRVLEDDREFFPKYFAAPLIRRDLPERARLALNQLADTIDDQTMIRLNEAMLADGADRSAVAAAHLRSLGIDVQLSSSSRNGWFGLNFSFTVPTWVEKLWINTTRHLYLAGIALLFATATALVVSFLVFRIDWLSRIVVYISGLLQTIPSIALLALMIPLLGIGVVPAIVALFLYSLLPIVRNTTTALVSVDPLLLRVAEAMGLTTRQRLRFVYVPLAMPAIMAGVRTSSVICIGTATLASIIGAGGLGDPIFEGIALNDMQLILHGAIPAAVLALVVEFIFEGIERVVVPKHLTALDQQSGPNA